jgi:hypothetical protein
MQDVDNLSQSFISKNIKSYKKIEMFHCLVTSKTTVRKRTDRWQNEKDLKD